MKIERIGTLPYDLIGVTFKEGAYYYEGKLDPRFPLLEQLRRLHIVAARSIATMKAEAEEEQMLADAERLRPGLLSSKETA